MITIKINYECKNCKLQVEKEIDLSKICPMCDELLNLEEFKECPKK